MPSRTSFTPARWSALARKHGNDAKGDYGIYGQRLIKKKGMAFFRRHPFLSLSKIKDKAENPSPLTDY
jgi:hypothetical protein